MSVAGAAALSACVCGPVFLAVCNVSLSRPFGRLSASAPSVGLMAAGAAALAALSAAAQLSPLSGEWFLLLGPPWIGAAPWVAGEIVAGPSPRQEGSFAAAVVTAYGAGVIAVSSCTHVLCQTVAIGAAATVAYVAVRRGVRPDEEPDADCMPRI